MSQEYDNNLRGVLFKNDRKEKESHPDYKGSCEVDGVEYWMAAWIKEGRNGKFMSLSFTEKDEDQAPSAPPRRAAPAPAPRTRAPAPAASGRTGFDDMDSDIPF